VRKTPESGDDLTVAEAAAALRTSPQTVRKLLRDGELTGRKQAWGSRFVWVSSRRGVDEFLSQHGRLEGRRRGRPPPAVPQKPFFLGPRTRATVIVVVLGFPLLVAYVSGLAVCASVVLMSNLLVALLARDCGIASSRMRGGGGDPCCKSAGHPRFRPRPVGSRC
jgi:excisionase family DNA binding protein